MDNIDQRFSAPSGYASLDSSVYGVIHLRKGYHLGSSFYFEPSLALALPWRTDADSGSLIFPVDLALNLVVPLFRFLNFHIGPGLYTLIYIGAGSPVTENNGTSTSTFYAASGVTLGFNIKPQTGFEWMFTKSISLYLDLFLINPMEAARRTLNGSLSLGIRI
jgi:hypothetical protein